MNMIRSLSISIPSVATVSIRHPRCECKGLLLSWNKNQRILDRHSGVRLGDATNDFFMTCQTDDLCFVFHYLPSSFSYRKSFRSSLDIFEIYLPVFITPSRQSADRSRAVSPPRASRGKEQKGRNPKSNEDPEILVGLIDPDRQEDGKRKAKR